MALPAVQQNRNDAPLWLKELLEAGFKPYIASSARLLPFLNTRPFGVEAATYVMENQAHHPFHEAYLLSNSLSFKSPDLKMPHWVLIDCVLMQTAVVGFMNNKGDVSENLLQHYRNDSSIDFENLNHIPVSGQIASPNADGKSLTGISLFSLARDIDGPKKLGFFTKALAFEVHQGHRYEWYYGVAQYDNPALRIHGRFAPRMEIYQPIVLLHPRKDMTLVYKMRIDFDPYALEASPVTAAPEPTFWMNAKDRDAKLRMQEGIAAGKRYFIAPPFSVVKGDEILLPIIEEAGSP
jgi:hypothetical protein